MLKGIANPQFWILSAFLGVFTIALILPLISLFSKAFAGREGDFVGLANYIQYFKTPALMASIRNTVDISLWSTAFSLSFGFLYAFALTRTNIKGKPFFKYAALIPIFIPTVVHALGLVYVLGNQGILTRAGLVQVELYGRLGIILSEIIYTFPQAFLMFYVALGFADGRLYEAADSMGVPPWRKFVRITLPEVKFTLVNAFFVCFTLAFTDFGAPKVIGGNFNVLATDIYKQVAGQFNMNMGAVVGTLLLFPSIISFIADRVLNVKNAGAISAKAMVLVIKPGLKRDVFFFAFCSLITLAFLFLVCALSIGALSSYYPYDMSFTLENFIFDESAGGMGCYLNSLKMSLMTAVFGTTFVFTYAYLMEKTAGLGGMRKYGKLLATLPLALPGMVVGLAFIFFFNNGSNPLHFIYGTIVILVIANMLHYFSVPFFTASACLKKLDKEYESVGDSMNIPRWKTFLRVSAPLSAPAILEIFMYYFVNAMVTVSALVFLYSAGFKIASVAIIHMEEAGNFGQSAAMSLMALLINVVVRALYEAAVKFLRGRMQGDAR